MNSEQKNYTEDKAVFKFFEDLEDSIEEIGKVIESVQEKVKKVNYLKSFDKVPDIDTEIPNLVITLNNKLVEYYQFLKEKGIKIFNMSKDEENIEIRFAPYTIIKMLMIETQFVIEQTLSNGFIKSQQDMTKIKDENWAKIEGKKDGIVRKFNEVLWGIKIRFREDAINELFYSEEEMEELRTYLKQYEEYDTTLAKCDIEQELPDLIVAFFKSVDLTTKQKEELLNQDIKEFLVELGKENLFEEISQNVLNEKEQKEELKSWELSESSKRKIQNETKNVANSIKKERKTINIEQTK